jgi:glucan phosphoethanolaminetransferase (alkaline phosphatase superfamily)
VLAALQIALADLVLLAFIAHTKFAPDRRRLSWTDAALIAALALASTVIAKLGLPFAALSALAATALISAIWLDAVLWAVFTIELGPGGVRGVVVSMLYRELSEIAHARRFFARNRVFALLPIAALAAHAPLFVPSLRLAVAVALAAYGVLSAIAALQDRRKRDGGRAARVDRPAISLILDFLRARALPDDANFRPRAEHAGLLERSPRAPARTSKHAILAGRDVVLVTLESVGRHHLYYVDAPFLRGLERRALASERHVSPSPTTNNAHVALLFSDYLEADAIPSHALGAPEILAAAGYRTVYSTAITTEHYGLRAILERSGFEEVIDRASFSPETIDRGSVSDWALVRQLPAMLAQEPRRPLFLHVHFTNTHVPYRVVDEARFRRRRHDDDKERFLDGIEEADAMLEALLDGLARERAVGESPLIAVTSDHGQAFGEHGYRSHGSAVIKEEIEVPLFLAHEALSGRVRASSHFDVLPTILDLLGLEDPRECSGGTILGAEHPLELFVWAGHPSRTTTSNFGLVFDDRKIMVDLVTGICSQFDSEEREAQALEGEEARYWRLLLARLMKAKGVR